MLRSATHIVSRTLFSALIVLACQANLSGQRRLVAFIVVDTDSKDIARDMNANLSNLRACIESNVPEAELKLVTLGGQGSAGFSRQRVNAAIANTAVQPEDAVLFYYSGHGYYESGRGSFFKPPADRGLPLYWRDIATQLRRKNARLTVSILDSCSVIAGGVNALPRVVPGPRPTAVTPLFQSLFFDAQGTFHLNSSSPGEYAICRRFSFQSSGEPSISYGSLFTSVLLDELETQDKSTNWRSVYAATNAEVHKQFRLVYKNGVITLGNGNRIQQQSQTVMAFDNGRFLK